MTAGKAPVRRRTASDRVEGALLQAAQDVLDRDGLPGVTVRAVAREAEVAPMGVYNRFRNKDGLLLALATDAMEELCEAVDIDAGLDPRERLRTACRNYRAFALSHPQRYQLVFGGGGPVADSGSAASQQGRMAFDVLEELVAGVAAEGGSFSPAEATEAAQMVWSAIHGAVDLELGDIGRTPDPGASYERLVDLLLRGLS